MESAPSRNTKPNSEKASLRKKRDEYMVEIRQQKREEEFAKVRQKTDTQQGIVENFADGANKDTKYTELKNFIDDCLKRQFTNDDFGMLCRAILSEDIYQLHLGAIGLRKILANKNRPPIQQVIDNDLVPRLLELMTRDDQPHLQLESAWALTNVASGSSKQTQAIIEKGGIYHFVRLLKNRPLAVSEQAMWAVGNLAAEGTAYRNVILEEGGMEGIVNILTNNPDNTKIWKHGTWAISNLCRGRPPPAFEDVEPGLPVIARSVMMFQDPETLSDGVWALTYMTDGDKERNQAIIETGVVPKLVEMLKIPENNVLLPTLRLIGNILTGNQEQMEIVVSAGLINQLELLIHHHMPRVRREVCWCLSNLAAGSPQCINELMGNHVIMTKLQSILAGEDQPDIKFEVLWIIRNLAKFGTEENLMALLQWNVLQTLDQTLASEDIQELCLGLEVLHQLLYSTENIFKGAETNPITEALEEIGIVKRLEVLQNHPSQDVYQKVFNIISMFYETEKEIL